jgi:hypothetical protein
MFYELKPYSNVKENKIIRLLVYLTRFFSYTDYLPLTGKIQRGPAEVFQNLAERNEGSLTQVSRFPGRYLNTGPDGCDAKREC